MRMYYRKGEIMNESITKKIADFVATIKFENLPVQAVDAAKKHILDCLGVALIGSKEKIGQIMRRYGERIQGSHEATLWGSNYKLQASQAAFVNGTLAHAIDYDDWAVSWVGHPTVAILPAALALAEKKNSSGKACLLAYILGVELGGNLSNVFGNTHYSLGWHNTGTLGSIGSTIASAKMLNLESYKIRIAMGIGASLASGLRENFGTMTKPLHAGNAARNGIVAAELADEDFTANESIIEADQGFSKVFAGGKEFSFDEVAEHLNYDFEIVSSGFNIKPYPSCGATHPMIFATLSLRKEHNIVPAEVSEIICRTTLNIPNILIHHRPQKGLEGKFSMEYCLSTALIDGKVGIKQFEDENLNRSEMQELIPKARFEIPDDFPDDIFFPQEVIIKLKNGKEYSQKITFAAVPGAPQNPMTWEDQSAKFVDCVEGILPQKTIDNIVELVDNFDELSNVNELTRLL